jgi:hypothetical protein
MVELALNELEAVWNEFHNVLIWIIIDRELHVNECLDIPVSLDF